MRTTALFSIVALILLACRSTTEPRLIPIQFQSTIGGEVVQPLTISHESGGIRVIGGYAGSACGAIGAVAEVSGSALRLTVGPRAAGSPCDAALVHYNYNALLDVPAGVYTVEVFHRRSRDASAELAGQAVITTQ